MNSKPILCLDFDGVLHSYSSGWQGAAVIADPPVDGAMKFLWEATLHFKVCIYSSRSAQPGGVEAMREWLQDWFYDYWFAREGGQTDTLDAKLLQIEFSNCKPSAFVTIDDRALTFTGSWPTMESLKQFRPWNKKMQKEERL